VGRGARATPRWLASARDLAIRPTDGLYVRPRARARLRPDPRPPATPPLPCAQIWWSPGASDAPAADPPAGALGAAVQALGRAGMLEQFAVFPVELLDAQVVSFRFAATNSRIVAAKVGPSPARLK
jgi:hypothetical protein